MTPAFWRGKRVFLTGHTGFKGSWLSLWLQALGAEVHGFALPPSSQPSLFEAARVADGMASSVFGAIRDAAALQAAMQAARPQIVIHMAAQALVRHSYANPVETYATNVMGTVHLFEAGRATPGVRAVVNVTTDKCYENREWHWGYRENDPLGGYDPYSSSKACAELVTSSYRNSYFHPDQYAAHGVALASARAGNVIGGGDWAKNRLLPDILAAFSQGRPVQIQNPASIRPWQHVLEPLRAYLMLAEHLYRDGTAFAEAWNIGPEYSDCKPVGWIADEMARVWGDGARWQQASGDFPHEATYLKLDISKIRDTLGWQPHLRLAEALQLTTTWAKQYAAGADMRELTTSQIRDYQKKIEAQKAHTL